MFFIMENQKRKQLLAFQKIPYKMETQKIINLVNDSNNKKFDIRNGIT